MASASLNELTNLDYRAKLILEAVDDEIARWHFSTREVPINEFLGMTLEEYAQFLFSPMGWARGYVIRLHGE